MLTRPIHLAALVAALSLLSSQADALDGNVLLRPGAPQSFLPPAGTVDTSHLPASSSPDHPSIADLVKLAPPPNTKGSPLPASGGDQPQESTSNSTTSVTAPASDATTATVVPTNIPPPSLADPSMASTHRLALPYIIVGWAVAVSYVSW